MGMRMTTKANARTSAWMIATVIGGLRARPTSPVRPPARRSATRTSSAAPRDAFTRTTSPSRTIAPIVASASSRSATRWTRSGGRPASIAASAIARAPAPTTTSSATVRPATAPTSRCPASDSGPSSSISPRTATGRPGSPARTSSAASIDGGEALYASSRMRNRPTSTTSARCAAPQPPAIASTIASMSRPAAIPTAAAPAALTTECRPRTGVGGRDGSPAARV